MRPVPPTASSHPQAKEKVSIRNVDLTSYIKAHLGDLNADLADLPTACGDREPPVTSIAPPEYGDLDGDGEEEAAIVGFSCLSGTGGPDFFGVLKLLPQGKLSILPIEDPPKVYKGRNPFAGLRGHLRLAIANDRLVELFPIYSGGEANCCPEGGERKFIFLWDGRKFVIENIIDVPPGKDSAYRALFGAGKNV